MSLDVDYKSKYLKYKQKYLELKGGDPPVKKQTKEEEKETEILTEEEKTVKGLINTFLMKYFNFLDPNRSPITTDDKCKGHIDRYLKALTIRTYLYLLQGFPDVPKDYDTETICYMKTKEAQHPDYKKQEAADMVLQQNTFMKWDKDRFINNPLCLPYEGKDDGKKYNEKRFTAEWCTQNIQGEGKGRMGDAAKSYMVNVLNCKSKLEKEDLFLDKGFCENNKKKLCYYIFKYIYNNAYDKYLESKPTKIVVDELKIYNHKTLKYDQQTLYNAKNESNCSPEFLVNIRDVNNKRTMTTVHCVPKKVDLPLKELYLYYIVALIHIANIDKTIPEIFNLDINNIKSKRGVAYPIIWKKCNDGNANDAQNYSLRYEPLPLFRIQFIIRDHITLPKDLPEELSAEITIINNLIAPPPKKQ